MIEIISQYEKLKSEISYYIDVSGYKNTFLSEQLNIGRVTFQRKKANGTFSFEEIKKLAKFIFAQEYIQRTEVLDEVLSKSLKESQDGKLIDNIAVKRSVNA